MKRGVSLIFSGLLLLPGLRCSPVPRHTFDAERDSLTLRAYYGGWSAWRAPLEALDPEWRPESVTVRGLAGHTVRIGKPTARPAERWNQWYFRIVRAPSLDSAWVQPVEGLAPISMNHVLDDSSTSDGPVLVTRETRWWITTQTDGGTLVGLRLVLPQKARSARPGQTYALVGRVVDAASGEPCRATYPYEARSGAPTASIRVAWDTAGAVADSDGWFRLGRVHAGWVKLNITARQHAFISRLVHVPADSLLIKLLVGSAYPYAKPVAQSAAMIPVPVPGGMKWVVPKPKCPVIVGRWTGATHCIENPSDSGCAGERGVFRFEYATPGGTSPRAVSWTCEGDTAAPRHALLEQAEPPVLWSSRDATEAGNRCWEFEVRGDTLVGQLIDPSTRVVARELFATRIRERGSPRVAVGNR